MSVHQESLDLVRPGDRHEEPPALEYSAVRNDSLTMFGAAIGGAVLGMLLTLLVLAIINGGTLSFSGGERLDMVEANVSAIDENVGALSYNVDVLAAQMSDVQNQIATAQESLQTAMVSGQERVVELQAAVDELSYAGAKIDAFVGALEEALAAARAVEAPTAPQ